jgi:hypothetical protein
VTWPSSPEWLLELQARFGALLRTPLDRSTGSLRADTSAYEAALVEAAEASATVTSADRLAVYHRQYWFRLFTVLQGLYPLTARLAGYWRFNELAAAHLRQRPPRGFDLDAVGEQFELSLAELPPESVALASGSAVGVAAQPLLEAARVDAAFHRVTRAPHAEPFHPSMADAARLLASGLRLSPAVALVQENWPLCELRAALADRHQRDTIRLPEPWPAPRFWLLGRRGPKVGLLALEPREAQLLDLLQRLPLEQALGHLEAAVPPAERDALPEKAQAWLARSVRLGVWAGFAEAREGAADSR